MNRRSVRMVSLSRQIMLTALLSFNIVLYAQDYSTLYSHSELRKAYDTYATNLQGVWTEDFLSRLTARERQAAANVRLRLPLVGIHKYPFDYYADSVRREVTIPILSVKFFDDIAIAAAWLEQRGCEITAVSDYVGVIRYQSPVNFPGRRVPTPLEALRVPSNVLEDNFVNDVSGKALKSGVYFLMAHELAHVIYNHRGYQSISADVAQRQEMEADAFALNVMRRISVPPIGMSIFFTVASRFELAPGDFPSWEKYEVYLRENATHPLTSDRLRAIADGIRSNVDSFTRGQASPSAWRPRVLSIANDIEKIGSILDDRSIRELQRYRSQRIELASLASVCR